MSALDFDRLHKERVNKLMKEKGHSSSPENIFISERVIQTLPEQKIFFSSYEPQKVLAVLPFTPVVYVRACPKCLSGGNLTTFKKLVEANLVVPILISPYAEYGEMVDFLVSHDHVSVYE